MMEYSIEKNLRDAAKAIKDDIRGIFYANSEYRYYLSLLLAGAAEEIDDLREQIPARYMIITDDQITAAARWLAKNVLKTAWDGLRTDGRAKDSGFDPWWHPLYGGIGNARQEDYRDVVRAILAEVGISVDQQLKEPT